MLEKENEWMGFLTKNFKLKIKENKRKNKRYTRFELSG